MRWGLFFFFAGMCVLMTITVYGFYPETKGLGIEETPQVFQKHWCAPPGRPANVQASRTYLACRMCNVWKSRRSWT
jgi:hypothetical protein